MEEHETPEALAWAEQYAKRSGVTVEWLRERGQEVRVCYCGSDGCKGWRMANVLEENYDTNCL